LKAGRSPKSSVTSGLPSGSSCMHSLAPASRPYTACTSQARGSASLSACEPHRARPSDGCRNQDTELRDAGSPRSTRLTECRRRCAGRQMLSMRLVHAPRANLSASLRSSLARSVAARTDAPKIECRDLVVIRHDRLEGGQWEAARVCEGDLWAYRASCVWRSLQSARIAGGRLSLAWRCHDAREERHTSDE
jgi:hypothetical protein